MTVFRVLVTLSLLLACGSGPQNPGIDLPAWSGGDPASPAIRNSLSTLLTIEIPGGMVLTPGPEKKTFVFTHGGCTLTALDAVAKRRDVRDAGVTRLECQRKHP